MGNQGPPGAAFSADYGRGSHRITFIFDCVLAPYSLINLLIGKDTVSVCHQKAEDFIFLHCQLNLLIVTIYFSLVHVNFKTGK